MKKLLAAAFLIAFIIYLLTSGGNTPYDYFTRLAAAFLHGQFWLTQNPPWLNELIPATFDKFYVPYAPMPAIISIPFVAIFGQAFPQQYVAHIVGAIIVLLAIKLAQSQTNNKLIILWTGILAGFGTINWFLAATGSSWYLGQLVAEMFLLAAIVVALNNKRPWVVGFLLGGAYLSRIHLILALPFFLFLFWNKSRSAFLKKCFEMGIGILPFFAFDSAYNFVRFGVPWDKGYALIPGLFSEPWYQKGLFNPLYIPNHLKIIFAALPKLNNRFPFLIPSWAGLAIWITTPAFIYSLFADIKERLVQFSWLSILLISIVIFSHGTTGFAQFGYRFAVDFYPFLILITLKGVTKTGLKWHHWALLVVSILVNLWGVLWINKFGWISY